MASRFDSARKLAKRLINKNGRPITYRQLSTTPADATDPGGPNAAETDLTNIIGVFLDYESQDRTNTLIQAGDKRCLIAKLDLAITPVVNDRIVEANGATWNIVNVGTLQPGLQTDTVMYDLQVRA